MNLKNKQLELLRRGLLEIRTLSSETLNHNKRINHLANILHNIPAGIEDPELLDENKLQEEVLRYQGTYPSIGINLLK